MKKNPTTQKYTILLIVFIRSDKEGAMKLNCNQVVAVSSLYF